MTAEMPWQPRFPKKKPPMPGACLDRRLQKTPHGQRPAPGMPEQERQIRGNYWVWVHEEDGILQGTSYVPFAATEQEAKERAVQDCASEWKVDRKTLTAYAIERVDIR